MPVIDVQLTQKDLLGFQRAHLWRHKLSFLLPAVLFGLLPLAGGGSPWMALAPLAVGAAGLFFLPRRLASQHHLKQPDVMLPTRYTFDESGVSIDNSHTHNRILWTVVSEFSEAGELLLLYTGPQTALILPKRFFNGATSPDTLRHLWEKAQSQPVEPAAPRETDFDFHLAVQMTTADWIAASRAMAGWMTRGAAIWFGLLAVMTLVDARVSGGREGIVGLLPTLLLGGFAAWIFFAGDLSIKSRIKKQPWLLRPIHYGFDATGVHIANDTGQSTSAWTALSHLADKGGYYLLYQNKMCAHVIPHRCFASEQQRAAWLAFVTARLPKR